MHGFSLTGLDLSLGCICRARAFQTKDRLFPGMESFKLDFSDLIAVAKKMNERFFAEIFSINFGSGFVSEV